MIKFDISSEDLKKEVTASYGASSFILEPGWYTLRVNELSQPIVKENGDATGYISFADVDSGTSFRVYVTYQVKEDKNGWRVKQTKDLIVRLCQATETSDWRTLVGKQIYAAVDVRKSKGKSNECDEFGAPLEKEFVNNDFKKGKYTEVILPVPKQAEVKNESFDFDFGSFNG